MSVSNTYMGRLGNNLFQYMMARVYAEKNGFNISTEWIHQDVIPLTQPAPGATVTDKWQHIDEQNISEELYNACNTTIGTSFGGFFQYSKYYMPNREKIKSYCKKQYKLQNTKDIVMHVRCDDYGRIHWIHPSWYKSILDQEQYDNLYLVMNPIDNEYIETMKDYNPIIKSGTVQEDFEFISGFSKIIMSNSTYAWWAAFLGEPEKVYTFKKWLSTPFQDITELNNSITVDGAYWQ